MAAEWTDGGLMNSVAASGFVKEMQQFVYLSRLIRTDET